MSWSTSELRVRLAPLNRLKPSSKIFYWPFQGGTYLWIFYVFVLSCVYYVFVRVCLYVLCGHLLGKGWPLGSRLWCLLWVCHFPNGILGEVWYLIVSIPDLCTLTYFQYCAGLLWCILAHWPLLDHFFKIRVMFWFSYIVVLKTQIHSSLSTTVPGEQHLNDILSKYIWKQNTTKL